MECYEWPPQILSLYPAGDFAIQHQTSFYLRSAGVSTLWIPHETKVPNLIKEAGYDFLTEYQNNDLTSKGKDMGHCFMSFENALKNEAAFIRAAIIATCIESDDYINLRQIWVKE